MSETKPPDENGSWLRWAVGQIGITDLIITEASPEPLTGLQVMDACIKELKEHEATAAAYREAMTRLNELECSHHHTCPWHDFDAYDPDLGKRLGGKWYKHGEEPVCECPVGKAERFVEAEIAANRFAP